MPQHIFWSVDHDRVLRQQTAMGRPVEAIASMFGRSVNEVRGRMTTLGIRVARREAEVTPRHVRRAVPR